MDVVLQSPWAVTQGAHMRVLKGIEFRKETVKVRSPSVELGDAALELSGPCEPVRGFTHGFRDRGREPPWSIDLFSYIHLGSPGLKLSILQGHAEEAQGAGGGATPGASLLCELVHCGQRRSFFGGSPHYNDAHVRVVVQVF